MSIRKRIKILLAEEQITLTNLVNDLSKAKDKKIPINSISQKLIKETIKFSEVEEILNVLGYEIIFQKRNTEK